MRLNWLRYDLGAKNCLQKNRRCEIRNANQTEMPTEKITGSAFELRLVACIRGIQADSCF